MAAAAIHAWLGGAATVGIFIQAYRGEDQWVVINSLYAAWCLCWVLSLLIAARRDAIER